MKQLDEIDPELRQAAAEYLREHPEFADCRGGKHALYRQYPKGKDWVQCYDPDDTEATHEIVSHCKCGEIRRERAVIRFVKRRGRIVDLDFDELETKTRLEPDYLLTGYGRIPAYVWREAKARVQFIGVETTQHARIRAA